VLADWPLAVGTKQREVPIDGLLALESEPEFGAHKHWALDHGFALHVKRARIGQSKHIRVRPRFDHWTATGTVLVTDEQATQQVLQDIWSYAGLYKGLGDWRPSSKTPGSFGMFTATVKQSK
jgi:hypothetical protein